MQTKSILICDDEAPMRELLRVVLEGDHRFAEAGDGLQALELAREVRPNVVILDVMLPGLGGLETLKQLRADPQLADTPVVVITAWPHMESAALEAGADHFFMKPFEPEALRTLVEELLVE
jgi:CheY-like chemotaxis protein